jgi:hypothetical protein
MPQIRPIIHHRELLLGIGATALIAKAPQVLVGLSDLSVLMKSRSLIQEQYTTAFITGLLAKTLLQTLLVPLRSMIEAKLLLAHLQVVSE